MKLSEAESAHSVETFCKAGQMFQTLELDDQETIAQWFNDNRAISWMTNVLKTAGIFVHRDTLRSHFRAQCQCPSSTIFRGILSGGLDES